MMTYEILDRSTLPTGRSGCGTVMTPELIEALLSTAGTNDAVVCSTAGVKLLRSRVTTLHYWSKRAGLKVHTRIIQGKLYAWVEPKGAN